MVAAVEALRKKERQDETQFTTKIDRFRSFIIPRWMLASVHSSTFLQVFFFESHPVYDQTLRVLVVLCFFFLYTDNSWAAHMILKTLASAWPAPWNSLAESEAGRQNAHIRSIMFFSISSKFDRLLRRSTHWINWNTPLSMPPAVPQALPVLPQIITHRSIHGQFALTCAGFFMLLFQLIKISSAFYVLWTELEPNCAEGFSGNASSILNKFSCHWCCVKLFILLARNFSSNKSINNVVESSLPISLGFGWSWRCCVRDNGQGKWRAWTHLHLNQEILLLRRFHGEKDRQKNVIQRIFLRNTVPVLCAVRKTKENVIQRKKFEKHNACIVCSEKMAMECRQVSTLEHEG